ncbi:hypothetical protein GCM10022228_02160 [Halomonas cibimaris]|uniref:Uncharacterized protein n=1 Tax=Halomonas cibimaris TaxID=657012 RepID=A0ABP7L5V2_9GAMM
MNSEARQLRQTLIFLRTSFEAIQHSIAGRLDDPLPCWLDASLLAMLSRELDRCQQQAEPLCADSGRQLSVAAEHCDRLLKQCPGVLSSTLCHRQLAAILLPLGHAVACLERPTKKRRWPWQRR